MYATEYTGEVSERYKAYCMLGISLKYFMQCDLNDVKLVLKCKMFSMGNPVDNIQMTFTKLNNWENIRTSMRGSEIYEATQEFQSHTGGREF